MWLRLDRFTLSWEEYSRHLLDPSHSYEKVPVLLWIYCTSIADVADHHHISMTTGQLS